MPFTDSCLEKSGICDQAYVGPLCQTCNINFAKFGGNQCAHCFNSQINILFTIIVALLIIIVLSLYIKYKGFKENF